MNRKSVLIVTSEFPPQPGGIGNHAYNLAKQLDLNNCEVSVIADQRSTDGVEEQHFDEGLSFKVHRIKIRRLRLLMYVKRLYKLMTLLGSADVVIASGKFSLWNVAFWSLFKRNRIIAVVHGSEVNYKNRFLRKSVAMALKRFDHIIAVSNYTKSLIAHLNIKTSVIPNGYDAEKWLPNTKPLKHLEGNPKLITVGNVTSRKGQMNVISHLPILKLNYPNIHYHCVGLPTQADDFLNRAKALEVETHVTFHGRINDLTMQQMLMASDIFVMLSDETPTGDIEGFGIAVIEANALGIPVIGALGSGIEDAIDNGVTGFLVDAKDSLSFIQKMERILQDYDVFSQASMQWASQHQWNRIVKMYLKIIFDK